MPLHDVVGVRGLVDLVILQVFLATYNTCFSGRTTIFHDSGLASTFSDSGAGKAVFGLP
jgi:hypothetical protein